MVQDIFDNPEETPEKNTKIKVICLYSEYWLMPDGKLKTGVVKHWIRGNSKNNSVKQVKTMPNVEVGEVVFND